MNSASQLSIIIACFAHLATAEAINGTLLRGGNSDIDCIGIFIDKDGSMEAVATLFGKVVCRLPVGKGWEVGAVAITVAGVTIGVIDSMLGTQRAGVTPVR